MTQTQIPLAHRVFLAHGWIAQMAQESGLKVLLLKGAAVHPKLLPATLTPCQKISRGSTDVDLLVHPPQVPAALALLQRHGWTLVTDFQSGSPFEHAATLWHDQLGYADVHRHFPGIGADPAVAFDCLWESRDEIEIAHQRCQVPSLTAQRLLLLLHLARGDSGRPQDHDLAWAKATSAEQAAVLKLAGELQAEVALAAATGHLEDFKTSRDYQLWSYFSRRTDQSRLSEWLARIRAAPSRLEAFRIVWRALQVNRDRLAMDLGRPPSRLEVARAYRDRYARLSKEALARFRRKRP